MKTLGKILLTAVGLGVVGVTAAALASGKDTGPDGPEGPEGEPPKQDEALERPGYKILPNCGGFEITDLPAATQYARDLVSSVPAPAWDVTVAQEIYGPVCNSLETPAYSALVKATGEFLYAIFRAVLQGAVDAKYYTEDQANETLKEGRDNFLKMGVDGGLMKPETVFGE